MCCNSAIMKNLPIIISLFLLSFFIFCGKTIVSAQTVSGAIDEKSIKRGKSATGKIVLTIPNELHINSNKPSDEFLIPTTVKFSDSNVKPGKITYPKATFQKFKFSESPLSIYKGLTVIKFTFTIPANFKDKEVKINAEVQYQACNEEVCFAPKKTKIILSAKVK